MVNSVNPLFPADAAGEIKVTLTNDMMFHCVMQRSKEALKHLVCSVKGLCYEDIEDAILLNPIDYGEYNLKEIILDTKILLKDGSILNVELQMYTLKYWIERSLLYLCRNFDTLEGGDDYHLLKETNHVCITDQELFGDQEKEFFAHFQFLNKKHFFPYSTLLSIFVLNLNYIDLATDEDKKNGLDLWARMFMAKTWEEFQALSKEFQAAREVAKVMYAVNADASQRTYFEAHRKYIEVVTTAENELARSKNELEITKQAIDDMKRTIADMDQAIVDKDQAIADKDQAIADRDQAIADKDQAIADKDQAIADKDQAIADKDQEILKLTERIKKLEMQK